MNNKTVGCACKVALLSLGCMLSACNGSEKKEQTKQVAKTNETEKVMTSAPEKTQATGLKREVTKEGRPDGKKPQKGNRVTVHYTGKLVDGRKFDSSVDRGEPFTFVIGIGQVIKGWDVGVMEMTEGEKCTLTIPADMAYGSRAVGSVIPANATLVFEVELLKVG